MNYSFPLAFAFNFFSTTVLLIVLGMSGKSAMAADVGIIQGATLALFYAFSANARNMILNKSSELSAYDFVSKRFILFIPLSIIAYYLSVSLSDSGRLLAIIIILRRCIEWFNEISLSEKELNNNYRYALLFSTVQFLLLLLVALSITLSNLDLLMIMLVWAVIPLFFSIDLISNYRSWSFLKGINWKRLIPHIGSTAIIGVTVYVFRLLILNYVSKNEAGDIFTAYAIGGIFGTIFANALGSSVVQFQASRENFKLPRLLQTSVYLILCVALGLILLVYISGETGNWLNKPKDFWLTVAFSLIGSVIMVYGINIRLRLLQTLGENNVLLPDLIANALIIVSVPAFYYLLNDIAFIILYLNSSVMAFFVYSYSIRKMQKLMNTI